jgi:predicted naringenin-chalcone synthase
VSCTGMSAPGLDLEVVEQMGLPSNIFRTSVNFMGCYAAIHALKLADALSKEDGAKVVIVCTELCTLHFQKDYTTDSITSSLIFGDGAAAVLVVNDNDDLGGIKMKRFYSEVAVKGKKDMCWEMSSTGFLMTLSGYVPQLIEEDFEQLVQRALKHNNMDREEVTDWCFHPGGKKIISALQKSMQLEDSALLLPHQVLEEYGNMSSPTILFVLKRILDTVKRGEKRNILGAAFGPGLTMETFMLSHE